MLQDDPCDPYRCSLFEKIRSRFGPEAAEHLKARLGFASCKKVIAWNRRADFMVRYPELLDPAPLAVQPITVERLLMHAFGAAIDKAAVLVRFQRSRHAEADGLLLRESLPWCWDLPEPGLAVSRLRCHGWLLLACEDDGQAGLLVRAARETRRLAVREIEPAKIARTREADIAREYLTPSFLTGDLHKCLR